MNPLRFATRCGPRTNNIDLSLIKDTLTKDGIWLRFSAQALNAFNHPLLLTPNLTLSNAMSRVLTGSEQANDWRSLQSELRLFF